MKYKAQISFFNKDTDKQEKEEWLVVNAINPTDAEVQLKDSFEGDKMRQGADILKLDQDTTGILSNDVVGPIFIITGKTVDSDGKVDTYKKYVSGEDINDAMKKFDEYYAHYSNFRITNVVEKTAIEGFITR